MTSYNLILQSLQYHRWANSSIAIWLKDQPKELLHLEVAASFPSIRKTLHHILEAEKYYLSILSKIEVDYPENQSLDDVWTELLETDEQLLTWFESQGEAVVEREIQLKRSQYLERYTVATLILHIINHTTYHRGQIVSMRHQLGLSKPPATDYYRYFVAQQLGKL
ncbi:MAG: DinB family protein [Bacteroidota bacterium]